MCIRDSVDCAKYHDMHADGLLNDDEYQKKSESKMPKNLSHLIQSLTCHHCLSHKDLLGLNLMLNLGSFLMFLKVACGHSFH